MLCFIVVIYIIILISEIKFSFLKELCTDATILVIEMTYFKCTHVPICVKHNTLNVYNNIGTILTLRFILLK